MANIITVLVATFGNQGAYFKRAFCTTLHVQLSFNILHLFCPQMVLFFFYTLPKVSTLAGSICVSGIPCFETNTSIRFYMLLIFLLYVICP